MTNELEKQFFSTFGIEPGITSCYHRCKKDLNCKECNEAKVIYPQVTDHILLELICICNSTYINGYTNYFTATGKTEEELKEEILKKCIVLSKDIILQVQALFKEGNTNDR